MKRGHLKETRDTSAQKEFHPKTRLEKRDIWRHPPKLISVRKKKNEEKEERACFHFLDRATPHSTLNKISSSPPFRKLVYSTKVARENISTRNRKKAARNSIERIGLAPKWDARESGLMLRDRMEDCRNAVFRSGSRNKLGRLVISRGKKREDEEGMASSRINTEYLSYVLVGLAQNLGL